MNGDAELITVFRSADDNAQEEVQAVAEALNAGGMNPVVLDDKALGVPEGAWEVRVPPEQSAKAEELIARTRMPDDELSEVSASPALDAETVFSAPAGTTAELEAIAVQSVLENEGIGTVLVGDSLLPNLPFEVRVAKEHAEEARKVIEEAEASGPAAAEAGAAATGAVEETKEP